MTFKLKPFLSAATLALLLTGLSGGLYDAQAQKPKTPDLPPPLEAMRADGAELEYLGHSNGLDGWVAIQNGQQQYFYVPDHGQAFLMGLLFDRDGKAITIRQVQALRESGETDVLDSLVGVQPNPEASAESKETKREFRTPAEQLYYDLENSNWVPLGDPAAPVVYSFMDPQCPHCHQFMQDLRANYIDNGLIQLRVVPVGFKPETQAQAAFLLAASNPQERWYAHLDGDTTALPIKADINKQGVQRNLAVMQTWKLNVTPLSVYRDKQGQVKILQGRPESPMTLVNEMP